MVDRRIFDHAFVPEVDITTENIGGKRYYVLPDGRKFRSVTTVLSDAQDKTKLHEWRAKVGDSEANKISTQAARRGTALHSIAEKYVLNEANYLEGAMPSGVDTFNSLKPIIDRSIGTILGVELPLYSVALNTAGRCDLISEFEGVTSVVDFKTSRKIKREEWIENYFLQTTCYALMFEWIYKIKVPQIVIAIAVDHEAPQVFIKDKSPYINKVIDIFTSGQTSR